MVRPMLWCVAVMEVIATTNYDELDDYGTVVSYRDVFAEYMDGSSENSGEVFDSGEEMDNQIFHQDGCSCWADLRWRAGRYAQETMLIDHDRVDGSDCYDTVMNMPSYDQIQWKFERNLARPQNMRYTAFPCARCRACECENKKVSDSPQESSFNVDPFYEPIGDFGLVENKIEASNLYHAQAAHDTPFAWQDCLGTRRCRHSTRNRYLIGSVPPKIAAHTDQAARTGMPAADTPNSRIGGAARSAMIGKVSKVMKSTSPEIVRSVSTISSGSASAKNDDSAPTGLSNTRSNCFFNALIQMLFASPSFVQFIMMDCLRHIRSIELLRTIHELMERNEKNILDQYIALCEVSEKLRPYGNVFAIEQHDAAEFLMDLLEEIRGSAEFYSINVEYPFIFAMEEIAVCTICDRPTAVVHSECNYMLNVEPGTSVNIQLALSDSFEKDVRGLTIVRCTHVYQPTNANITLMRCVSSPQIIILRIERSIFDSERLVTKKNTVGIDIDVNIRINSRCYALRSFIMHFGGAGAGHFIEVIQKDNKWYGANDESVYRINDVYPLLKGSGHAYLLLYQRNG